MLEPVLEDKLRYCDQYLIQYIPAIVDRAINHK